MTENAETTLHAASHPQVRITLVDLARAAITAAAPTQLDYLELVTTAWDKGTPNSAPRWTGGTVGSGTDPTVLAEIIYPLLTGTFAQIAGAAGFTALSRKRWGRRERGQIRSSVITLPLSSINDAHQACVRHGTTLGLSVAEATLLADAVRSILLNHTDDN
jgi:hypothetical protein